MHVSGDGSSVEYRGRQAIVEQGNPLWLRGLAFCVEEGRVDENQILCRTGLPKHSVTVTSHC